MLQKYSVATIVVILWMILPTLQLVAATRLPLDDPRALLLYVSASVAAFGVIAVCSFNEVAWIAYVVGFIVFGFAWGVAALCVRYSQPWHIPWQ